MIRKKKTIATAAAVAMAAALVFGGGTLAYFSWTSDEVDNVVANNYNWVSLTEYDASEADRIGGSDATRTVTNDTYEIIPGTSQDKNPLVTASYSLDSYVFVEVTDTSGGLISWEPAEGWTLLEGTDEHDNDNNLTYAVYYRLVTTEDKVDEEDTDTVDGVTYYVQKFSVLDGDSISYSSAIGNGDVVEVSSEGIPTFTNTDIRLTFQAYIMQADIVGISTGEDTSKESALACWNAMNASSNTSTVTAGNVAVETEEGVTTTAQEIVVTSDDEAYTATVPKGVVIDTDTAIVTDDTTTLILVVEEVGEDYSDDNLTVSVGTGASSTVYDIYIIGVSEDNEALITVTLDIGKGLSYVGVEHEGDPLSESTGNAEGYSYNSETGILTIYTKSFSEYAVTYLKAGNIVSTDEETYATLEEAAEDEKVATIYDKDSKTYTVYESLSEAFKSLSSGDTLILLKDCELDSSVGSNHHTNNSTSGLMADNYTVDLNGYTLTIGKSINLTADREIHDGDTQWNQVIASLVDAGMTETEAESYFLTLYGWNSKDEALTVLAESYVTYNIAPTTVIVENGTISIASNASIYLNEYTDATFNDVTFTYSDSSQKTAVCYYAYFDAGEDNALTFNSCTFNNTKVELKANSSYMDSATIVTTFNDCAYEGVTTAEDVLTVGTGVSTSATAAD